VRSLTPTLLSAQRSRAARPCVQVTVDDRHIGVGRLRPQEIYAGSEGEGPCAMTCSDGYILRAWVDANGDLRLCRTEAGSASGWGNWSLLASSVNAEAQVALAADGSDVYLLYVSGDGRSLLCRQSDDAGLSWGEATTVYQADAGCRILSAAAVCATAHQCICLFADDGQTQDPDDLVHVAWLRQGQWTTAAWARDAGDGVAGLAAVSVNGDETFSSVHFVLCGAFEDTTRPAVRLYHLQLTMEGYRLWTYRGVVLLGDAPDFTWSWPALVQAEGDRPRLFLRQDTPHGGRLGHLFLLRLGLTGPVAAGDFVPLDAEAARGVGAACCDQDVYFGCAAWVRRSPVYNGGTGQRQDVSQDVVRYEGSSIHRGSYSRRRAGAGLTLLLDNSSGRYGPSGEASGALRLGSQVCLREGYVTADGCEVACQEPLWVGEIERSISGLVLLRCYDGWGKLWRSRADRIYEWHCAPAVVLQEVLERFGFVYSDDGSESLYVAATPPRFSLAVRQLWGSLVNRVLDYCGCELRFFVNAEEEETWPSARAHVFTPGDEPCYSYGADEHAILQGALSEREVAGTWVQVFGEEVYGEALNLEAIGELGFVNVRQLVDQRLSADTDVTAEDVAGFALRRFDWARAGGWLMIRPNVGQELLDVVSVELRGQVAQRRVLAIERQFDRKRGVYQQRLLLGA